MVSGRPQTRFFAALVIAALAAAACGGPEIGPRVPRAPSSPGVVAVSPAATTSAATARSVADAPADLHDVDWASVPLPGEFCGIPGLVTFTGDEATAVSRTEGPVHLFRPGTVVHGDIQGDPRDEAAVEVYCDNGGGTGGGVLAVADIVFAAVQGRLTIIGIVTPQKDPPDTHASHLADVQLSPGRLTAYEAWYRPSDRTCCPTGTAVTVWTLEDGYLIPGTPNITS